ncbi:hypothetical protein [Aliarcobacter cryaerophilus]|uniref:hypothetical protein n=1 Tax=Aliarcobacter cryaerophilus TaxID=28198 RepID=UPI0021B6488A|nr:hypothetical protein [Aliarcobacter cryaerophilus]MCT7405611.1 hypothetical protein [Aliarcobacter cryaerophilus]MCT7503446.1 hypothetical protein [Aliarcobacter cryaerophilus]
MKYVHLENNKILGWYDDLIHSEIPTPNIEVSDEVWQEAININANCYENEKFIVKDFRTLEEIEAYEKSLIPKTITLRQARLYLLSIGLLDDLENIINQNRAYQIEWEYANQIERESPLVKILGQALSLYLDDDAIDNMFMEASKI